MRTVLLTLLMLASTGISTAQEIHRCPQDDGTITFQEIPCSDPGPATAEQEPEADERDEDAPADDFFEFVNPFDEPQAPTTPVPVQQDLPEPVSQDRAVCEKTARDAIDAIDLEMRKGFSKEQGQQYQRELLELTRQLRACKQL